MGHSNIQIIFHKKCLLYMCINNHLKDVSLSPVSYYKAINIAGLVKLANLMELKKMPNLI